MGAHHVARIVLSRRGEIPAALRHYEYAQRLSPGDAEITLAIGAARLSQQDPRAAEAFALVATRDDVQEAWLGLAAAHHGMGEHVLAGAESAHAAVSPRPCTRHRQHPSA